MDYVLEMPVMRLFSMLDAGRAIHARNLMSLCDVQAITICDDKYYTALRDRFEAGIPESKRPPMITLVDEPKLSQAPKLEGVQAQNALVSMFGGG